MLPSPTCLAALPALCFAAAILANPAAAQNDQEPGFTSRTVDPRQSAGRRGRRPFRPVEPRHHLRPAGHQRGLGQRHRRHPARCQL